MQAIIRLARDQTLPARIVQGLEGYLNTLPGFVAAAFDDEGNERPPSPDQPMYDLQVARQQHGYLSMQFTRSMQSLADEYGFIFKAQLADIDVLDVVLNRRILVVLIPALEKSGDEAANLGKIVASCLKGMMGATLGNTVEGGWENAVGSKQTRSSSSFMTVFDEVGYYTAKGMAVMAAQARSLGFSLVFATQDLPSMEKRIKSEAKSIVGNCNLKIFGRIEDPTETKEFVQKHGGGALVMETRGFTASTNTIGGLFASMPFHDDRGASMQARQRVDYDHLRGQREGEAHLLFGDWACKAQMFYAVPEKAKALRVHRFLPVPGITKSTEARDRSLQELTSRLKDKAWTAASAGADAKQVPEIAAMAEAVTKAEKDGRKAIEWGIYGVTAVSTVPVSSKSAVSTEASAPRVSSDAKPARGSSKVMASRDRFDEDAETPKISKVSSNGKSSVSQDLMSAEDRNALRAGLPTMQQGDEFQIEEIDRAPVQTGQSYTTHGSAGFGGTDADLSVIIPSIGAEETIEDISSLHLPENITAILSQSAQKLNEGLRGKADGK
jgi:intracellular multiplication protein IcmO